ncbi:MAG: hypothetical protein PHV68_08300 [Candidatus Gastranaerophilales bacterium]|nr:hypothetical protein [Candidatus Gastranaerophilales bacterium]
MAITSHLAKIIGLGAVSLATYEAVGNGFRKGTNKTDADIANSLADVYISHQFESKTGKIKESVKKYYRETLLDVGFIETFLDVKNVVVESVKELGGYLLPIGLGLGAFFTKVKKPNVKFLKGFIPPFVGKACAIGLGILGGKVLFQDIMGISNRNKLD